MWWSIKKGFLLAVMVMIACVHDSKTAYLLARCRRELHCNIKARLVNAGYHGDIAGKIKNAFRYNLEVVVSCDKVKCFKPIYGSFYSEYPKFILDKTPPRDFGMIRYLDKFGCRENKTTNVTFRV